MYNQNSQIKRHIEKQKRNHLSVASLGFIQHNAVQNVICTVLVCADCTSRQYGHGELIRHHNGMDAVLILTVPQRYGAVLILTVPQRYHNGMDVDGMSIHHLHPVQQLPTITAVIELLGIWTVDIVQQLCVFYFHPQFLSARCSLCAGRTLRDALVCEMLFLCLEMVPIKQWVHG